MTNSVAILSDSIHDIGDAISIGFSYFMEKKSKKEADEKHTFSYNRYSILSSAITAGVLIAGSAIVIVNSILRIINPLPINYNGMLIFAIVGVIVNSIAMFATKDGATLNQRAVNLHMLEDVLGWVIVLIGAIIMKFTNFTLLDPILSIGVAIFVLISGISMFKSAANIMVEKAPKGIRTEKVKKNILKVKGVKDIHHFRIWSLDENNIYAIMHLVVEDNFKKKNEIREILHKEGITNTTIEIEKEDESCNEPEEVEEKCSDCGHHHHHHHH